MYPRDRRIRNVVYIFIALMAVGIGLLGWLIWWWIAG